MADQNRELFERAMTVTDPEEAKRIFEQLVELSIQSGRDYIEACSIVKENLGYQAGYYDNETRERVERLFDCAHPFFGKISENGPPTPEQAFKMGQELGKQMRDRGQA